MHATSHTRIHPLTGHRLAPVGYRKNGSPIWPIMGGSEAAAGAAGASSSDAQQTAATAANGTAGTTTGASTQQSSTASAGTQQAADQQQAAANESVESLPEWAQKLIKDTRAEAAQHRTGKNDAETKHQSTLEAIAKALGLKNDETPDPEKLAADLADTKSAERQALVKLAVFQQASKHQGDPNALLDSNSFLAKVKDFDPTSAEFATQVDDAIKAAVGSNPKLKTAPAAAKSGAEITGGSGEGTKKSTSLAGAVTDHYSS